MSSNEEFVWSSSDENSDTLDKNLHERRVPIDRQETDRLQRRRLIEIVFPGDDNPEEQIRRVCDLEGVIERIENKNIGIRKLEKLVFVHDSQLKYFLSPHGTGQPAESARDNTEEDNNSSLEDFAEYDYDYETDEEGGYEKRLLGAVQNAVEEEFAADTEIDSSTDTDTTGKITTEIKKLDFSDLGPPVPVSRLAVESNPDLTPIGSFKEKPLPELYGTLLSKGVPFIFQIIIGFDSGKHHDYTLSVRLAAFEQGLGTATERDWITTALDEERHDVLDFFDQPTVYSNYSIDLNTYFSIDRSATGGRVLSRYTYVDREKAANARQLVKAIREFKELIHGTHSNKNSYQNFDLYSKIPIAKGQISAFLRVYYVDCYDIWATVNEWNAPEILPVDSAGEPPDNPPQIASTESPSTSSPIEKDTSEHDTFAYGICRRLRSAGYEQVKMVEQGSDSVTDIRAVKDSISKAVEVCRKGKTKPANVLVNVLRGEYNADDVIFYTRNKKDARTVAEILKTPFNKKQDPYEDDDDAGVRTYTMKTPDYAIEKDGRTLLLPEGDMNANWRLFPDGMLELWVDQEAVARGHMSESPEEFEYDLPRFKFIDGEYVVFDADGNRIGTGTKTEFTANWTRLAAPLVPSRVTYLPNIEIRYVDREEAKTYTTDPKWNLHGKTQRYSQSIAEFFSLYTTEVDGAELYRDHVRGRYYEWYKPQTDRKKPGDNYFGTCTSDAIKTKRRSDEDDNSVTLYKDRTWIFPEGTYSPILPFVDE